MVIKQLELERVAVKAAQYPAADLPEFAFCGRSNVGKSSFINAMFGRKNLARTSGKPGKTRTINFYRVNDALRFVDLPGYGYAVASKKDMDAWAKTINEYLAERENLSELILLVDMRHAPSAKDRQMYDWIIESGFAGMVVATKADKLSNNQRQKAVSVIKKTLSIENTDLIFPFSAVDKKAVPELWDVIENMAEFHRKRQ
ncbi:Probable GTP-binding protein EngB [Aedoeadaptatus ivorii]|uniref:Probable GTP-binding protein EngB n=1 Tax=Aedoeadaptatus ivorii TaxID=54006 RepID=A0A3S4YVV3_9FIRM|nr:ribosome biogenesis GTP-binding protein YihA/YsxC [Peptoniphilus ivorii]MDQ0508888.1 GTP-binding protein [Peptoniphilus ivorii]VEJ35993.1 Probable GTP-binding protein EngB [Peptoniphilus ivorii]